KRRAGKPARLAANSLKRDYGVVFVPVNGATPGVQTESPCGQTRMPPAGAIGTMPPLAVEVPTAGEQPLPSQVASNSTPKRPAVEPAPVIEMTTQFCDGRGTGKFG